jgi:hypothetical protein
MGITFRYAPPICFEFTLRQLALIWFGGKDVNGQREDALFSFVRALVMGQYGRTGYATPWGAL